jgi:hypothetical protein
MLIKSLVFLVAVSISQLVLARDIPVELSFQARLAKPELRKALAELKIGNNVISVNGSFLKWNNKDTLERALAYSPAEIKKEFESFLKRGNFPDNKNMVYILDLEAPIHPKNFATLKPELLKKVFKAFKLRIKIARAILPKSKIGLYGIMNASGTGIYSEGFIKRFKALKIFGAQGLYDDLDYIVPVLYQRFGAKDGGREATWEAMVRQGVEASSLIKNSKGESIPLMPFNTPVVWNGGSLSHLSTVPYQKMQKVVKILAEYESVKAIVFWLGWDGHPIKEGENSMDVKLRDGSSKTIYALDLFDYFQKMNPVKIVQNSKVKKFKHPRVLLNLKDSDDDEKNAKTIFYKDFETGSNISKNDAYQGKGCFEVKGNGAGKTERIGNLPLETGKDYKFTFAIKKSPDINKKRGTNQLIIFNQPKPQGRVFLIRSAGMWKPADGKWHIYEQKFSTKGVKLDKPFILIANKNTNASLWLDEMKIIELSPKTD